MQYVLLIYADEASWDALTPEQQAEGMEAYEAYGKWLTDKGWMRGGDPLTRTTEATSVRVRDGQVTTTDGPFAETKEQLGGYYVIECDNLDQAIEAATRLPGATYGTVEVRPVMAFDQG